MIRVAVTVDNPYRDLPGLVLLAVRLCQQGVTCHLVPMYYSTGRGKELQALAPDFVLLNYLRWNNQGEAEYLHHLGIPVGVLDNEGGVVESFDTYFKSLAPDPAVRGGIAVYFSWGAKLAEQARRAGWFGGAGVVVTGAPRYDFYAAPLREAALLASPWAKAYGQPLVLVNGNFGIANPQFQTPEQEVETLVSMGYDRETVLTWQRAQVRAMDGLTGLTNRLAAQFPRATFVYRPHPFEKLETYHDLLERRDNLHLLKKGSVDGWVLRSAAVIQRSCSTGLEAAISGIPSLSPAWLPAAVEAPAVDEVSLHCPTEEDMARRLRSVLDGDYRPPAQVTGRLERTVADWFCRIDGQAHRRVADGILRHATADGRRQRVRRCRERGYDETGTSVSWRRRARAALAPALGRLFPRLHPRWEKVIVGLDTWPSNEKYFNAGHVQRLVDAITSCPGHRGAGRVGVRPAQERGDYHFGYRGGQAVTVYPA